MSDSQLNDLARRAVELTGAKPPEVLESGGVALSPASLAARKGEFYLVGLIGGKDVGKSSLVNGLAGQTITHPIGYGEGTAGVTAYAHRDQVEPLRGLLDEQVPGRFRIVPHDNASLRRQVLVDLPDIDSHWVDHIEITRRMLRYMLFPLWIQSVEKYADRQPQELLKQVAAGNSAENFLFVLNKVDQLGDGEAGEELRTDFAKKLAGTLELASPPKVWLISAANPGRYELPALAALLARQRSEEDVGRSLKIAERQRVGSVLRWLDGLELPRRLERVGRLEDDAHELLAERLEPLVTSADARGPVDSATAAAVLDDVLARRVGRWPLMRILHVLLNPLAHLGTMLARPATTAGASALDPSMDANSPVAGAIQVAFAELQRMDPLIGELYRDGKPWEALTANRAAGDLQRMLEEVAERQRAALRREMEPNRWGAILAPWRWLLTIGVLLWFPLVQPVAEVFLTSTNRAVDVPLLIVKLLAVTPILQSISLVLIWLVILWTYLRWDTGQRVRRRLERWHEDAVDPALSRAAAVIEWAGKLTRPLAEQRKKIESLLADAEKLRRQD